MAVETIKGMTFSDMVSALITGLAVGASTCK